MIINYTDAERYKLDKITENNVLKIMFFSYIYSIRVIEISITYMHKPINLLEILFF